MKSKWVIVAAIVGSCALSGCVANRTLPSATHTDEKLEASANNSGTTMRWTDKQVTFSGPGDPVVMTATAEGLDISGTDKAGGAVVTETGRFQVISQSDVEIQGARTAFGDTIITDEGQVIRQINEMSAETIIIRPSAVLAERVRQLEAWDKIIGTQQPSVQAAIAAERDIFIESVREISGVAADAIAKALVPVP